MAQKEGAAAGLVMLHEGSINGLLNLGLCPSLGIKGFCRIVGDSDSRGVKDFNTRFKGIMVTCRQP
jgi:hypothetical protein